jgi:nucleotide-binding universal stress UspA family protein
MFQKILVALDLMDSNEAVFQAALALAQPNQSELRLLHVLSGDGGAFPGNRNDGPNLPSSVPVSMGWEYAAVVSDSSWELYRSQWREYTQRGLETLRHYAHRATEAHLTADISQVSDAPGRAICDLATNWGADVIVVGSHRRRGLQELMLGSVSNYVTHHAPCSVFVVNLAATLQRSSSAEGTESALQQNRRLVR